jgi:hypothetical protein
MAFDKLLEFRLLLMTYGFFENLISKLRLFISGASYALLFFMLELVSKVRLN